MTLRRRSGDRAYVLAPLRGYQLAVEEGGRWRVVRVVRTELEAEAWLGSCEFPSFSEIVRGPLARNRIAIYGIDMSGTEPRRRVTGC